MNLQDTIAAIRPADAEAIAAARAHQDRLTKPQGALGQLEDVSVRLAGLAGQSPPPAPAPAAVAIFVGDHGVHAQGVTPWPQEVTGQMVANFLGGGAVVNVLARQVGASVRVVDVGMASSAEGLEGLVSARVRPGTADLSVGPAMSRDEALAALEVGITQAEELVAQGNRCLITGDMGVANTTASAALVAAFTGTDAADATGFGAGIDDETHARKLAAIRRALALHSPDVSDPRGVLAAIGGLEHAALAGFLLGGAALRIPVIIDGVIACSAALVAQAFAPSVVDALIAGHLSVEPGAAIALQHLGLEPLLDLRMRLGEGSGAVLALPLVQAAAAVLSDVATFDSAGVSDKQ